MSPLFEGGVVTVHRGFHKNSFKKARIIPSLHEELEAFRPIYVSCRRFVEDSCRQKIFESLKIYCTPVYQKRLVYMSNTFQVQKLASSSQTMRWGVIWYQIIATRLNVKSGALRLCEYRNYVFVKVHWRYFLEINDPISHPAKPYDLSLVMVDVETVFFKHFHWFEGRYPTVFGDTERPLFAEQRNHGTTERVTLVKIFPVYVEKVPCGRKHVMKITRRQSRLAPRGAHSV